MAGGYELMPTRELLSESNYTADESFEVDTRDDQDHTFCGIIFDIEIRNDSVPFCYFAIHKLWIRGLLGNITVWYKDSQDGSDSARLIQREEEWELIYEGHMEESPFTLSSVDLNPPLVLKKGKRYSLYIHCARNDDMGIVYNNQRNRVTYEDQFLIVHPGMAHISPIPFDNHGWWGVAWRPHREFVGRISYSVKYLCWKPVAAVHLQYPESFRESVFALLLCNRREKLDRGLPNPFASIPVDVLLYIINMCGWDWFINQDAENENLVQSENIVETHCPLNPSMKKFRKSVFQKLRHWTGVSTLIFLLGLLLNRFLKV
mmetsp:Transcript_8478/g.11045  ORF Transcript_8478/g.11045 Transcript_8478/m.11045 type:complete len:318 (-) Transcript_8478:1377-2330(-)